MTPMTYQPLAYDLNPRPFPQLVSIVIAAFNEEETIPALRAAVTAFSNALPAAVEIVIVNDGSVDGTFQLLAAWARADYRIKVVNLARNFGHQAAATAGLDCASGDAVVLMDADLQDPPDVINAMIAEYCRGYDVVYGRRVSRLGETAFKRLTAWTFYRVMRLLTRADLPVDTGDFRLISKQCLEQLSRMRETHRFLRGMVAWVGFPQTAVPYERQPRAAGTTKYPLLAMLRFAWTAAVSFSPAPLRLSFAFGVLLALIGTTQAVNAVVRTALGLYTVPGWTSLMVVVWLVGGAILISIGVVGEYVARIFEEVKGRPLYIVGSSINLPQAREDRDENRPRSSAAVHVH